jgi:hypothetical protein
MPINRTDFASECMTQALSFGVNAHYLMGVGQLRSGINDDTQNGRIGPFRMTQTDFDKNSTAPEFQLNLKSTGISVWPMQCAACALMTYRAQNIFLDHNGRYPSALELYRAQWPNDPVSPPGDLQKALDNTAELIAPAADAILDHPSEGENILTDPDKPTEPIVSSSGDGLFNAKAPGIMRNLMQDFGFSKIQAAGILGNIGHECGGFKEMQELHPISGRGGFGWAQWTGDRRVKFETFCKNAPLDPTSDAANYGFLKQELQTSFKGVISKLKSAPSVEEAVKIFEANYEIAGIVNIVSRIQWAKKALRAFGS